MQGLSLSPILILGDCLPPKYKALAQSEFFKKSGTLIDWELIRFSYFALHNDPDTGDFQPFRCAGCRREALQLLKKVGELSRPLDQYLIESEEQAQIVSDLIFTEESRAWDFGECGKARKNLAKRFGKKHALIRY